ncbi:alkaline phosphatase D family protein [Phenylobacterium immobile]|uniref:alkaline phosphatase D family protein n=1 Tax=Phenylobacterium immobile TaxID=21 RepID=UPI000A7F0104|nr:alkaline phosphatase D family protein [Phenylobacterium immobile]
MDRLDFLSRRRLLVRASAFAGAALAPSAFAQRAGGLAGSDDPFTLGVASGDPEPDGMVLWTRLAPRPLEANGGMPPRGVSVRWEVAEDQGFRTVAAAGRVLASPQAGHSVHVETHGLRAGRDYFYRFMTEAGTSAVGRTRTAPEAGADVEKLRIAFCSCQKYEAGFYAAYRHMVEDNPDLILFLGDYIYEKRPNPTNAVRLHKNLEPYDIGGYRVRYATYKTDPLLQAAHAAAPWMVIWDDHEVENDYGNDKGELLSLDYSDGVKGFLRRRAAAYQAYYEHMPLRRRSKPVGPDMLLYRTLDWGRRAQFQFLDDRQHRADRPCLTPANMGKEALDSCRERLDLERSMLGMKQERWLLKALSESRAQWNVLAQQTLFAPLKLEDVKTHEPALWNTDGWDGAPASRDRIVTHWREAKVANPMVLGGDIHTFAAADVREGEGGPVAAPSFVGGSITSLAAQTSGYMRFRDANPDLKLYNGDVRGYGRVEFGAKEARVDFRALADARREDSPISTLASYVVENGRHTVEPA